MADMIRPEDIRRIISDSDRREPGKRREPQPLTRRDAVAEPPPQQPPAREPEIEDQAFGEAGFEEESYPEEAFEEEAYGEARYAEPAGVGQGISGGYIDPPSMRRESELQETRAREAYARDQQPPLEQPPARSAPPVGAPRGSGHAAPRTEARGPGHHGYDGPPLRALEEPLVADIEDEEEDEVEAVAERRPRRRLLFPLLIALVALAGFAVVLLYGFKSEGPRQGLEPPTLVAQVEVDKVKPSEPGGLQVPNRDVQVLDHTTSQGEPGAVVLQPPPEEPAPLPPVPEPESTASAGEAAGEAAGSGDQIAAVIQQSETQGGLEGTAPTANRLAAPGLSIPPRPSAKLEGREAAVAAALSGKPVEAAAAAEPAATAPAPAPAASQPAPASTAPAATASGASGSVLVQLASLTSAAAAESSWETMSKRYTAELGGLSHSVQKIEIEGRGTFYRLRAGPFPSREVAQERCNTLKDKGQACIVVAP